MHLLLNGLDVVFYAQGKYNFADKLLFSTLEKLRRGARQQLQAPAILVDCRSWVNDMRLIKSEEELALMRRTCKISAMAHTSAMQKCRPGMSQVST